MSAGCYEFLQWLHTLIMKVAEENTCDKTWACLYVHPHSFSINERFHSSRCSCFLCNGQQQPGTCSWGAWSRKGVCVCVYESKVNSKMNIFQGRHLSFLQCICKEPSFLFSVCVCVGSNISGWLWTAELSHAPCQRLSRYRLEPNWGRALPLLSPLCCFCQW